ncbi:MAG: nucleotide pyrophosphohydrolase [Proteobacteria bacterium]|nr:nucleotide pyrophosphohydrolase [Pseudomonadota bacterium]
MAELEELKALVAEFVAERDWAQYHSPRNVAAAIAVEAAELQEIFLWRTDDDVAESRRADIEAEAADILITLLSFCNSMDIDLGTAMRNKLARAREKYPVERVKGRREKYDEYPDYNGEGQ